MLKHFIIVSALVLSTVFHLKADEGYGWTKYPIFNYEISSIEFVKDKVYFVSGGNLFSFDEDSQETYCYTSLNKLTDDNVKDIYYNRDAGFLLVVYENSNMDVLYEDGEVVNLPEIRDASITSSRTINDVSFSRDYMLIGADFGIVVYDLGKMEVKESGIFDMQVAAVCIEEDRYLIYTKGTDSWYIWFSPISERHNNLSKFTRLGWGLNTDVIAPLSDTKYLFRDSTTGELYTRGTNAERDSWSTVNQSLNIVSNTPLKSYKNGYYTTTETEFVYIEDGVDHRIPLPESLRGQKPAIDDNVNLIWLGDANGIAKYDLTNPNSPVVLNGKMIPEGVISVSEVGFMRWSGDGERLYIQNLPYSNFRSWKEAEGLDNYQTMNVIEAGFPREGSLMDASADIANRTAKWQELYGNKRMYGDPMSLVEDPDDPDTYYCANNFEGVYVIKRNSQTGQYEEIGKFTSQNSPIPNNSGYRAMNVNVDPKGNLWVGYLFGCTVLPADKRRKNPSDIVVGDWKVVSKMPEEAIGKDMGSLFCKKSNMAFYYSGGYEGGLVAIDTKGTYDDLTDDVYYVWTRFTDQDGVSFEPPTYIASAIEDDRGCVWFGTSSGIFEISNPSQATNPDMKVRRIKVPRNDGTDYADYLLSTDLVYWMSVDPAGRKWAATEGSGLFLISETGDKIIKNFTQDNSPLQSNLVATVECDPKSNRVYVGTMQGLYSFLSDAAPGTDELNDILAYPNPVRPEYSGDITITGLMDNSIVKIADVQGNVIYQTRSQGGMATWSPYTSSGARVRTGVYFVIVTSSDGSSQVGGTTKIMVVN